MHGKTAGSSLIIVLLMSLIIMGSVIALISSTSLLTRKGSGYEKLAYSNLLGADAGINSFAARVQLKKYTGKVDNIDCFVQGTRASNNTSAGTCTYTAQLPSYSLSNGNTVQVEVVAINNTASSITVRSTSTTSDGTSKVVLQDFLVTRPPTTNISIPAALTSNPSIDLGGNGKIYGAPYDKSSNSSVLSSANNGILPGLTTLTTGFNHNSSPTITVADDSYLDTGSFVRVNGYTMQVTGKASGYTSTNRKYNVTQVPGGVVANGTPSATSGSTVDLVQFAVRSAPTSVTSTTARIPISDPTGFYVNDVIYFRSGSTMYSAQVTARGYTNDADLTSGYLDIKYPATAVGSTMTGTTAASASAVTAINIGTGISRYVPGASSAGSISGTGSSDLFPSGAAHNSSILSGSSLFSQTFSGKTKQDVYDLSTRYDLPPAMVLDQVNWVGPSGSATTNSNSYSINDLCGTGILIITGNLTLNGTCNSGFTGLLYVMGDFSNQGNSTINGAVVVEGQVYTSGTKVKGTMTINYDPNVFLQRGRHLAVSRISAVTATWRQQ
ncbi:hypothetical protein [Deinococcus cellulosilyticus]|uniref:Type 4 fimbrial biogenesis protein PilX N-terminal domain-containing protein n=1 Tax=Deinococcus cellulosilyticus (strain DSM 18568 / NBRC 106333 / KACC 11606 / 5516J-15) TaxID=1223518 RepID=A0A511N8F3_DEIC1|nr:hypothetical protein [Deinococcus cellulosilyticus]GEM49129.1 hypothetical protein DC3_47640 [Deinococcus cellulosilyticus NBRC 106333 = KACC 11606]